MFIKVKNQQSKSCPSCYYIPSWPDTCPYQKLSSYLKQYESYGLHKILASGQYVHNGESESSLEQDMSTGPYLCFY